MSSDAFATLVLERIRAIEATAAAKRRRAGAQVLGRRAVLDQRWSARPASREPRRQLDPRVAARGKWSRIEALLRHRAFRAAADPFRHPADASPRLTAEGLLVPGRSSASSSLGRSPQHRPTASVAARRPLLERHAASLRVELPISTFFAVASAETKRRTLHPNQPLCVLRSK